MTAPGLKPALRWAANRALAAALRLRSRPGPPGGNGATLVFAPHPDDDVLGCGGLILLRRLDGQEVRVAYLTDGSGSHPGHPHLTPADVARVRRAEAVAATGRLGVDRADLRFLDARDGTLDRLDPADAEKLVARIAAVIDEAAPHEIFLPYRRDRSSEHEAGFALVMRGLARTTRRTRILEYPIWSWWSPRHLVPPLVRSRRIWRLAFPGYEAAKRRALAAHASQFEPAPPWTWSPLPPDFGSYFLHREEFYFEIDPAAG